MKATIAAEAPLVMLRLELSFAGGGEMDKQRTPLPFLYGIRQRQVVEVNLIQLPWAK